LAFGFLIRVIRFDRGLRQAGAETAGKRPSVPG
jgi:hypothetical protein